MDNRTIKQQIMSNSKQVMIAGPCSAESPLQLLETANALKQGGKVDYFRAGLWKPRTSPDSFQGVGATGLKWLKMVKEETGMKVATEVGCERHVNEALKYDIDLLWIGARTVSNPFVLDEIAGALRGTGVRVMVKNPLNPDIELWYGAINRFLRMGVKNVGAIHRGFSLWGKSLYRNAPLWELPLELRRRMPELLLICDPSHIAGKRNLVPVVAGRAVKEGFGGLMVEVHPEPDKALSDAAQQLDPQSFFRMMGRLDSTAGFAGKPEDISPDELTTEIEMVDELLIHTIASRIELCRQESGAHGSIPESAGQPQSAATERGCNETAAPGADGRNLPEASSYRNERVRGLATGDGLRPDFIYRLLDDIRRESSNRPTARSGISDK